MSSTEEAKNSPSPPAPAGGPAGDAPPPKGDAAPAVGNENAAATRQDANKNGGGRRGSRGGGGNSYNTRQSVKEDGGAYGGNGGRGGAGNNNRQRRRTSTKGGEGDGSPAAQGGDNNKRVTDGGRGGGRKKEWSERKSYSQQQQQRERNGSDVGASGDKDARRTRSTNSQGKLQQEQQRAEKNSARTASCASNGEGLDYGNYDDLDEPFSDSESESFGGRARGPQKMQLPIPRGRIRTLSGTVPLVGFSPKWGGPTMCLSCLHFFDLPEELDKFTEHLLKEHHIVVSEMNLIVDPKRYIEHWRQRFAKESIDKVFPRIEPAEGDSLYGKTEYFFEMSAGLQEDFQVRQRLAMRRLEEALSCQQREREDANFSLQCIFCRYTARGNRSKIIHHLYMIHHLNLGSPDNLVFVTEYIEHLKEKLVRNECIYCEKTFADRNTLMDHMRKRNHREVNPKNHYYDKFYIINYLELGKRWLDVLAEDFEDTTTAFVDSDEEEEDNSWCEWQEDNVDEESRVLCLCCEENADTAQAILDHMREKHSFDFLAEIEKGKLGTYERAKVINYIRKQNYTSTCWVCGEANLGNWVAVYRHIDEKHKPIPSLPPRESWDNEECLVGMFGNDHLVWMLEALVDKDLDERADTPTMDNLSALIDACKLQHVEGVVAEDLPDLPELEERDQIF